MFNVFESFTPKEGQTVDTSKFIPEWKSYGELPKNQTSVELPELTITGIEKETNNANEDKATPQQMVEAERVANAIEDACNGGFLGWGTNFEKIKDLLQDKTRAEIELIDKVFAEKYGKKYAEEGKTWGLKEEFTDELSGATLDRALSLLHGVDGNNGGDAARIHAALIERGQAIVGKTDEACEQEIRSKLATMNSKEIAQLEADYRKMFPGKELRGDLLEDKNLSEETKKAIEIYLKGVEARASEDTVALAETALQSRNLKIFEEAFRDASPEARKAYASKENQERISAAFDNYTEDGSRIESLDTRIAKDFVEFGQVSSINEVRENRSVIGDNERAIEQALMHMSKEQRNLYVTGRDLVASNLDGDTDSDKSAIEYYNRLHQQLVKTGNETEVLKWEDQILHGKETLVSALANHRGIFNDDEAGVYKSIENMSREDWIRLKMEPGFRQGIDNVLSTYLSESELQQAKELLDQKAAAVLDLARVNESYEASKETGNRSLETVLKDIVGAWSTDSNTMYDAISRMTSDEQRRYREDENYRKSIDLAIKRAFEEFNPNIEVAIGMLSHVLDGEKPHQGLPEKITLATTKGLGLRQTVSEIEQAFKEDATLQKRLQNPETESDKQLADAFNKSLRWVGKNEYEVYIKPLLESEDGRLSLADKVRLRDRGFDDDERGILKDIADATTAEKEKLKTDSAYRATIMEELSAEQKRVADYTTSQGKMQLEDEIRVCILGAGTDESGIKKVLTSLTPSEIETLKADYARKYGSELIADLHDELGGQDKLEVRRMLEEQPTNVREQFNRDQDRYFNSRDGIGSRFVDACWDGTGLSLDNAMNAYSKELAECARKFQELPEEERKKLIDNLNAAADLFIQSKGAAADAMSDALLAVGAVAGAGFTGGASLGLIALMSVGGAAVKVSTKALIMGGDYDWTSTQPIADGVNGAVNTGMNFVGAGELQKAFRLGRYASVAGAGFAGGFAGGVARESFNWDTTLSADENLGRLIKAGLTSGAIGAGAGVAFTAAFDLVGKGVNALRAADAVADNSDVTAAKTADAAADNSDVTAAKTADAAADNSDVTAAKTADAAADNSDAAGRKAADAVADNADVAKAGTPKQPRLMSFEEVDAMYKQLAGEDGGSIVHFRKNPDLEYTLKQVDSLEHPNGLFISTKESTIITKEIRLADGTIIPEGTALPYGVQISPGAVETVGDEVNRIVGGKIIVPGDGVQLANGTILRTADLADNANFEIFKGQVANPAKNGKPADWIVLRETTDQFDNPIYDAYTNSDATKLKKWRPVTGQDGVYNPLVKPDEAPREMVQLPADERIMFDTNYGRATASEPSFLARQPDGKYYLVSYKDVGETMLPVDARSEAVIANLNTKGANRLSYDSAGNLTKLDLGNNTSISLENGRLTIQVAGEPPVVYPGNGEIIASDAITSGDGRVAVKFGNRRVNLDLNDDMTQSLKDLNDEWSRVNVNADGSFQHALDKRTMTYRDSSERLMKVEHNGQLAGTFKYGDGAASRELLEVDFGGPNGFRAERIEGSDNLWRVTEGGKQYDFNGRIEVVSDATSDVGLSVRRISSDESDSITELLNLDGKASTRLPDGSAVYKNADGQVTSAYNGYRSASYVYANDGSGLQSVEMSGRMRATKVGERTWRIEGETVEPYTFKGDFEVNQSGSLSRIHENGVRESFRLDGSRNIAYENGTLVKIDAHNRIVAADSAAGNSSARFDYVGDSLTKVSSPNLNARRIRAEQWVITTPDGSQSIFNGEIYVNPTGEVWADPANGTLQRIA